MPANSTVSGYPGIRRCGSPLSIVELRDNCDSCVVTLTAATSRLTFAVHVLLRDLRGAAAQRLPALHGRARWPPRGSGEGVGLQKGRVGARLGWGCSSAHGRPWQRSAAHDCDVHRSRCLCLRRSGGMSTATSCASQT